MNHAQYKYIEQGEPTYQHEFAIDTETFDPDLQEQGPGFVYEKAKIVGISIYTDTGFSAYYALRHKEGNTSFPIRAWLREHLSKPMVTVYMAQARYDLEALWSEKIDIKAWIIDVLTRDSLIDEDNKSYSLDSVSKRNGLEGKNKKLLEDALLARGYVKKDGKPDWTKLWKLPVPVVAEYAEMDTELTFKTGHLQQKVIHEQELERVDQLESEIIPVLHQMRTTGVPVDIARADEANSRLLDENNSLLAIIHSYSSGLNPFSPKQLGELVQSIGLETPKTEKGNDSIPNEFLLHSGDKLLIALGEYRQAEKIRRDFIEGMILNGSHKGRLYPQWFQTRGSSFMSDNDTGGTRSGRIACANPNLSQIPSRHPTLGPLVRSLFIPEHGARWFKGDIKQQEPRIMLHYALEMKLQGADALYDRYIADPLADFHQMIVDIVAAGGITTITRGQGKTIGLGLMYGMGKKKLAASLGLTMRQAQPLMDAYYHAVPFLRDLQDIAMQIADERGFIKTIMGRRRRFDEWEPPYFQRGKFPIKGKEAAIKAYGKVRKSGLHRALNSIVQGGAAEMTKTAMVAIHKEGIPLHITLYDELGSSVNGENEAKLIASIFETALPFKVPQVCEWKISDNWSGK